MFEGEFSHTLDDKGRMIFPARFRTRLGNHPVMTRGLNGCLYVFTEEQWHEIRKKLGEMPILNEDATLLQRVLFGGATEISIDSQGRVAIPQHLRQAAGIEREVTVVGLNNKIEIWDTARYQDLMASITPEQLAASARIVGLA